MQYEVFYEVTAKGEIAMKDIDEEKRKTRINK